MNNSINWALLVAQDRAKAIGIPWSREDRVALKRGISPEDIRAGLITDEDVERADEQEKVDGKLLFRMKKVELVELAKEMKITFDENETTRAALIKEISQKSNKVSKKIKVVVKDN